MLKQMLFSLCLVIGGVSLALAGSQNILPKYWQQPQAMGSAAPEHWSVLEKNLRPEACAQCHQTQFQAWQQSRHAAAYSPGLIGQFPAMGHTEGNDCLVCHAPLQEQMLSAASLKSTVPALIKHPRGFSKDGNLESIQATLPLRHAGVTCASCHVRDWQRFGPPMKAGKLVGKTGHIERGAHNGFTASTDFESSQFCASCHQFPDAYAINGKPLENTLNEWQASAFSSKGIQCQTCHMPDRKHEFKGIHDKKMVLQGLKFSIEQQQGVALVMTSDYIGHAFPTYVTPKVVIHAKVLDAAQKVIATRQWSIIRKVFYNDGWQEEVDTRLMPGDSRSFHIKSLSDQARFVQYTVEVIPDYFYKGVYQDLLDNAMDVDARVLVQRALDEANANDYQLYSTKVRIKATTLRKR